MKELVVLALFNALTSLPTEAGPGDPCQVFREQGYECSVLESEPNTQLEQKKQCGTTHGVWQCWT